MKIIEFEENRVVLHVQDPAFVALKGTKRDDNNHYYRLMTYIYNVSDYNAYPARQGMNELETHNYSVEAAGLSANFIPDDKVARCIKSYFRLRDTVSVKYIREIKYAMRNAIETVKMLNDINTELLDQAKNIKSKAVDDLKVKSGMISTIKDNQVVIFDMASKAQDYIVKLKKLEQDVLIEQEQRELSRGGSDITDSMIPDEY